MDSYEPTQEEIVNYANWLSLVDGEDDNLMWIPRKAMRSSLPKVYDYSTAAKGAIFEP